MKVVLLSSIYGGYDTVKPLPEGHGFDEAIIISDNPNIDTADGWKFRFEPTGGLSPRMAAKLPKLQPFDFVDADIVVWLDGSFQIVDTRFKEFCLDSLQDKDFVTWRHPDRHERNCLYAEAEYCGHWPKYSSYAISEQVQHYRGQGMPEGFGLWACGTIVWRNTPAAKEFGRLWLMENIRWSIQDQISFPYLIWKHQPNFGEFDEHEYDNPYLVWQKHRGDS